MYIAREKYDALVSERDAAKQELETMKAEAQTSEGEFARLETERKEASDKVSALTTENESLRMSYQQMDQDITALKAENEEMKKLPGAETARVSADKEQRTVSEAAADLATSDDKSFVENVIAVQEKYLK
jgi:chromosome segregation ATPase